MQRTLLKVLAYARVSFILSFFKLMSEVVKRISEGSILIFENDNLVDGEIACGNALLR